MIWCDLDETLIWAVPLDAPRPSRALLIATLGFDPGGERQRGLAKDETEVLVSGVRYAVHVRPGVIRLLAALRRLDRVRLLTLASRPYALAMNRAFGLGFKPREIVTRESFGALAGKMPRIEATHARSLGKIVTTHELADWAEAELAKNASKMAHRGFSALPPMATNVDPGGVLIQNYEGDSDRGCRVKCKYLGIQRDGRCVRTSGWRHQVEPWRDLVREVEAAMALSDEEIVLRRRKRAEESRQQLDEALANYHRRQPVRTRDRKVAKRTP